MTPNKILMCKPEYFEVNYSGNEFMKHNINNVDREAALKQWNELKKVYEYLGYKIKLIAPQKGLVDMVFTANQSLPFLDKNGKKKVILSKMKNEQRAEEVKYFKDFYLSENYEVVELPVEVEYFESMGDAVIDYERNILFGGYGHRTQDITYDIISNYTNYKVVRLRLINPILYHLDTCFSLLNSETCAVALSAFDAKGLNAIRENFKNVLEVDEEENMKFFACNCHSPDGKNVIVQRGSVNFKAEIKNYGFHIIEVETAEFLKSGGSVFCMKLMMF